MNTAITLKKLAVITTGLVLTVTASMGHAQQKVAEEMLERQLKQQQLAEESANKDTDQKREKDAENTEQEAPKKVDISILYDDEGNTII